MADSEQRQIETDLLFWHRYAAGYRHPRQYGRTRLMEIMQQAVPPQAHSGATTYDHDQLLDAIKKVRESLKPQARTLMMHPRYAERAAEYNDLFERLKVTVQTNPYCPEDTAYVYPTSLTTLPKEETP